MNEQRQASKPLAPLGILEPRVAYDAPTGVRLPFAAFHQHNSCLMCPSGNIEDIAWIREKFGDPVEITQEFIRHACLHYRGIAVCSMLDQHVPEALKADHAAYVSRAKREYRDAIRAAECALIETGDAKAYDQAVAVAFLRHRGARFGALEGAFTPRFDPYY